MNILVVDDDTVDQEYITRLLKSNDANYNIIEARTVDEALTYFKREKFDIVLLDYSMPRRNGIEMLFEIRNSPANQRTAVVMMSNSEDELLAKSSLCAGAQDFLVKTDITADRLKRAMFHAGTRFTMEQELQQNYQNAKILAERDGLTGLANRYLFDETLKIAISENQRTPHKIALLLMDLDHFKHVNDSFGHDVGDELLKKVVTRIQGCLRGNELFARLGGDEFAIIISDSNQGRDAGCVGMRVLRVLRKPFSIRGHSIITGASIGVVFCHDDIRSPEKLYKFSDIAMYKAKKQGRNTMCFFHDEMQEQFLERYKIEQSLREALSKNELILYYQPIFNCSNSNIEGFETLVHWDHNGELKRPKEFISIADESNLIIEIGEWVIEQSIAQLAKWSSHFEIPYGIVINLSAVQLSNNNLIHTITHNLKKYHIPAHLIEFDVTESALLAKTENIAQTLHEINQLGCKVALDDFGIGLSSVTHMLNVVMNTVKIDHSLMPPDLHNSESIALLRGLVSMIKALGLTCIAEGVETEFQLNLCRELEVDKIQGYYFSEPLSVNDVEIKYLCSKAVKKSHDFYSLLSNREKITPH